MTAIFKREFKSYFLTPIGYILLAAFYVFESIFFITLYSYGQTNVPSILITMETVIIFVLPFLTMRMLSEDRRQKVDQVLITSPVSVLSIVLGKFFAALAVYAIAFLPTAVFELIISFYVKLNVSLYLYAFFGILLLGATLIAIGMFISSLTESSALSAVLTIVANLFVMMFSAIASMIGVSWLETAAKYVSFMDRFGSFGDGVFSIPDIIYFLSIAVAFIVLTAHNVERRRWA